MPWATETASPAAPATHGTSCVVVLARFSSSITTQFHRVTTADAVLQRAAIPGILAEVALDLLSLRRRCAAWSAQTGSAAAFFTGDGVVDQALHYFLRRGTEQYLRIGSVGAGAGFGQEHLFLVDDE